MASVPMDSEPAGLVGVLNVHTVRAPRVHRARRPAAHHDRPAGRRARCTRRGCTAGCAARERAHERFTEQVVAAQETERRRLAGDIHDGISQRLVTLSYHLDAAHLPRP